jgi:hypothetical protein
MHGVSSGASGARLLGLGAAGLGLTQHAPLHVRAQLFTEHRGAARRRLGTCRSPRSHSLTVGCLTPRTAAMAD